MFPGLGSLDPKKVQQVQQVSQRIKGEIKVDYTKYTITLKFIPSDTESEQFTKSLLPQFSETLATQLVSFFRIKGEIIEITGEKKKQ